MTVGVRWASRVTALGLEAALPALLGQYLDRRWGTGSVLTIAGSVFGFVAFMVHVLAIGRESTKEMPPRRPRPSPPTPGEADGSNEQTGMGRHG